MPINELNFQECTPPFILLLLLSSWHLEFHLTNEPASRWTCLSSLFLISHSGGVVESMEKGDFFNEKVTKSILFSMVHDAVLYCQQGNNEKVQYVLISHTQTPMSRGFLILIRHGLRVVGPDSVSKQLCMNKHNFLSYFIAGHARNTFVNRMWKTTQSWIFVHFAMRTNMYAGDVLINNVLFKIIRTFEWEICENGFAIELYCASKIKKNCETSSSIQVVTLQV